MTHPITLLHIDASARLGMSGRDPHGSHTRRMSQRFISQWQSHRPHDQVLRRDVARHPPALVTEDWIAAAFTPPQARTSAMEARLLESDALVDELMSADVIVIGVPMYNFGLPAPLKSYVDNIVRVGRTFGFERQRQGAPYWPLLADRRHRLVLLSSRGDSGYEPGGPLAPSNHVEPALRTAFGYIGITEVASIAVEYDEFADQRLADGLLRAERQIDQLVREMLPPSSEPPPRLNSVLTD